jgi:WD40 repeat protein
MRIIEACDGAVRSVAVSADGRFVAASAHSAFGVFRWETGEAALWPRAHGAAPQIAFTPDGWVAHCAGRTLSFERLHTDAPPTRHTGPTEWYAGGVAVSPDGRLFVAAAAGHPRESRLLRWSLPAMKPQPGFDIWSPFHKLAFSPNGHFLAGIWPGERGRLHSDPAEFELRFAASGGLDYRRRATPQDATGFVSFTPDSSLCAFGWADEFHVVELATGTSRYARRVEAPFRDAAFTASGRHLATVGGAGRLTLWDAGSWEPAREYDWGCGPLTCLAFTADGSAGVCGTADGRLVQFDVDE